MQIIIPMSGFGERFRRAGYKVPKPLIEVDGKPIIAHVIDMFPGESEFLFICNNDHLNNASYKMKEILNKYCPIGRVIGIPSHKLGPINAVKQVEHMIDFDRPVVVNYCDFSCYWDWLDFKKTVTVSKCDGAIPAYKGFHPHSLGSTNYAYIREDQGVVLDIQEKQPYTSNRMEEFASSGTYYFSSGRLMSEALNDVINENINVGGEFYVSLAYKSLLSKGKLVSVYPLQHFMQWGTPDDLAEYQGWSNAFRNMISIEHKNIAKHSGTVLMPMAGLGQRFLNEGYTLTKPLISVSGKPMVIQAVDYLPLAQKYIFVLRTDMPGFESVVQTLKKTYQNVDFVTLEKVTNGQACTVLLGLEAMGCEQALDEPVTIGACDSGALYNQKYFDELLRRQDVDVIVWGTRGHVNAIRHPEMYGWIESEGGRINSLSVKAPLESPSSDPIAIGTFTFKKVSDLKKVIEESISRDAKVNGEFYLDSCINDAVRLGLKCYLFEVDSYISWGTPNDLRTFEYWQSCFSKWLSHPYELELDSKVPFSELADLHAKYQEAI